MGEIVFRLGCRLAIVEQSGIGLSSGMGMTTRKMREAIQSRNQMSFDEYAADWLDEEVALSEGLYARRKTRGRCNMAEWDAWVELRFKKSDEMRRDGILGRRVRDEHPEWEANPQIEAAVILGRGAGDLDDLTGA